MHGTGVFDPLLWRRNSGRLQGHTAFWAPSRIGVLHLGMHRAGKAGRARRTCWLNANGLNHHWRRWLIEKGLGFGLKLCEAMLAAKIICLAVVLERSRRCIRGHSHAADWIDCGIASCICVFIIASHLNDCNASDRSLKPSGCLLRAIRDA